ncbi:hypothetical protein OUZ56_021567 [Daphnia magna]|uniref:Uncharacterized protein n=1 Tax=Daphnia magna TaxID=35525 RepID=A0ABR0AUD2_9CRUS|nr:hypothetical protein OUZ56_021567 [Daphnia magna]
MEDEDFSTPIGKVSAKSAPQPPCVPTQQHCSNRTTVFNVVGQSKLTLITAAIMGKISANYRRDFRAI